VDGTHFRQQAPIGPYVVDFFCPAKHLIIELDGGHHNDDETAKRDREGSFGLNRKATASFDFGIRRSRVI
jgi:very-short-patch-repair endonuclease